MNTKSLITRVLAVAVMLSMALTHVACNTMEGVGKDTQRAGEKLENSADRNK